ncbi:hypothetical protein KM043_016076 [Ampulex compressa]|nr:hypothetical protein KM043_016076 [Ampulex compressa]
MQDITLLVYVKSKSKKEERFCWDRREKYETASYNPAYKQESVGQRKESRCYNCGEEGHIATRLTKPKTNQGACYTYGKIDHEIKECPDRNKGNKKLSEQVFNVTEKRQKDDKFERKIKYEIYDKKINIAFEFETQLDSAAQLVLSKNLSYPTS